MTTDVEECFKTIIVYRKPPKVEPMFDGYTGFHKRWIKSNGVGEHLAYFLSSGTNEHWQRKLAYVVS